MMQIVILMDVLLLKKNVQNVKLITHLITLDFVNWIAKPIQIVIRVMVDV